MSSEKDKEGLELGFSDGIRYSLRESEQGEFSVHAKDYVHNKEQVLKTFKTKEGAMAFAEDFLA